MQSESSDLIKNYKQTLWFDYLSGDLKVLAETTFILLEQAQNQHPDLLDYSYIIFPLSKAYEGYLKQLLLDLNLINGDTFYDKHFRLGRALNPDIRQNQRDEFWLYDDVAKVCGHELSRRFWNAWLDFRNGVFHFFPKKSSFYSLPQIERMVSDLSQVMADGTTSLKEHLG